MQDKHANKHEVERSAQISGDPFKVSDYFDIAERSMVRHWRHYVEPVLRPETNNLGVVVDLAVGHGRNTEFLRRYSEMVIGIDINEECLEFCRGRFSEEKNVAFRKTEGADLGPVDSDSVDLVYCFDAMVHFQPDVVKSYLRDIRRVLKAGGMAFLHHSNWTAGEGADFRTQPHWRNYMSKELFAQYAREAGLDIGRQRVFGWDESIPNAEKDPNFLVNSDCISVLIK